MKHVIRGLFAAPILALAAVLCIAPATASPAPTAIEKVVIDTAQYDTAAPATGSPAATAFAAIEMIAPDATASPMGYKEKGTAPCAEKLANTASSSSSTIGAHSIFATPAPMTRSDDGNTAVVSSIASSNTTVGMHARMSSTAPPNALGKISSSLNRQLLAATNGAAPELVGNTS